MGMPNVLMIGPSLSSRGGMATVEKQLVELLPAVDCPVTFLETYNDGPKPKKLAIAAAAYLRFCCALPEIDVVHVHMASRGSYERKRVFIYRALRSGKRVALHLHGGEFDKWFNEEINERKRAEVKRLFADVDAVIVLSEEWRDMLRMNGFDPQRLVVMHNGVEVPPAPCDPCSHQDVLFLGRLDANKSPDVLLRASSKVLHKYPDAKLLFGGDGYPERYETLAMDLGIAESCEFLGWVTGEDKEKLFNRAGVYCLPSKNEGMPMSVLEAMAHGIPTIATPVGGVPQVIENGADGYIVPVDDVDELANTLDELLGSANLRKVIGFAGRGKIARDFDIDANVTRLANLYRELAERDGR